MNPAGVMTAGPELFVRYALEFAIILPAAVFALLPVRCALRFNGLRFAAVTALLLLGIVVVSAYVGLTLGCRPRSVLVPVGAFLFVCYFISVRMELSKKLFCFCNAAMLCVFCSMYTIFIMAPFEFESGTLNMRGPFLMKSGAVCLALSLLAGVVFFRTLTVKLPALLREERLGSVWNALFAVSLFMAVLLYYITPNWTSVVMTGRVRSVSLLQTCLIPIGMLALCHALWRTADELTRSAGLQQENTVLLMENKRYSALRRHIEEVRALRHDFRHHLLVIDRFLESGQTAEIREYMGQLKENAAHGYASYCGNNAVDAMAAHYAAIAGESGTQIEWKTERPGDIPVRESDYCAILGNLLENALRAVGGLPEERRKIKVISSMLSDSMIGLSVDNPFEGKLSFGKNGLPRSEREKGGLGLISVSNMVHRYGGFMNIKTDDNIFSVDILMYGNNCDKKEGAL